MNDQQLREVFQAERAADLSNRPSLTSVLSRRRKRRRLIPAVVAVAAAGAALFVVLIDRDAPAELASWQSPTEFLLGSETPSVLDSPPSFNLEPSEISLCESCL